MELAPGESSWRPVFIANDLEEKEKQSLIALLKVYRDVFAWDYTKIPDLSIVVAVHRLNVLPVAKPIKQQWRVFRTKIEVQIRRRLRSCYEWDLSNQYSICGG